MGLLISCEKKITETRYYPNDELYKEEEAEIIQLKNSDLNFKEITNCIGTFYDGFGKLVVEFDDKNIRKRIIPFVFDGGLIKYRNTLEITSDSILIDKGYKISELKRILKRHYTNNSKIPYYSESPQKALVVVTIDTNKTAKELKNALIHLTRTYDQIEKEINDSIKLTIFFDYFRQIPPPPRPPKPKNNS
ncbi:hypothetical protein LDL76_04335 [Salegentibacter mishustinae]|uniref:hypothetical protein n=1 Tax=Salegentibacter mishustinae TaxID=270918 RepID=UPI001CE0EBDD|nr:hypothetical protein [Salegentibacter mishustinae]UBZ07942.1 hypothetical protein LDL76_04335 [Salegentibacter mishustinae]